MFLHCFTAEITLAEATVALAFAYLGECRRRFVLQPGDRTQIPGRPARIQISEWRQVRDRGDNIRAVRLNR